MTVSSLIFSMNAVWLSWISLPIIGAFIGWLTNWVAIKMLFHPREERSFLGLKFQGVFPKRQAVLAHKLGDVVAEQLLSIEDLKGRFNQEVISTEILKVMDAHLDTVMWERLPKAVPMMSMFMSPALAKTIKDALAEDMQSVVGTVLDTVGSKVGEVIDIRAIVREKVEALSGEKVEELLEAIMKREFKFVEVVGGVLGFLIGVVQVVIVELSK